MSERRESVGIWEYVNMTVGIELLLFGSVIISDRK